MPETPATELAAPDLAAPAKLTAGARLADPETQARLCAEIVALGSVRQAARALGMNESCVWYAIRQNAELAAQVWSARQCAAEQRWDECTEIADESTPETVQVAKLRIDTRMRSAGKLMQGIYGETPAPAVNVVNQIGIVCDETTRARLIELREQITGANAAT